ncbi:thyrotropin receptor-like, partial [Tropilaelaps mercedesae]
DLTYNKIESIPPGSFSTLENLRDLNLGNNLISELERDAFIGLRRLQVLAMERNRISYIHPEAFRPLTTIEDLNMAENTFPQLPHSGLTSLRRIAVSNNPRLRDFPPPESFPRITRLYLSYSYHCCAYSEPDEDSMLGSNFGLGILPPRTRTRPVQEPVTPDTVLWLKDGFGDKQIDFSSWNRSHEMGYFDTNASDKFPEFTRALLKAYGSDYIIPDNLVQYAEEYMEDYRGALDHHGNGGESSGINHRLPITCLPTPTPFMPCEDLFGWWTLRCGVWVVFLLALLGNGLVVVVLSFGRSKIDVPRFLVCNLAMADFLMGIYLGFLAVVDASTLSEFKFYGVAWQTSFGCQLAGFLGVLSSELSVYTLAVITMERNYAITHAMHLNKRLSLKHATYIMSVGWSFAFVMALLPLFGVSDYRKFAVCLPFETEDRASLLYVVFLLAVNGLAFLILMGCYLKMYCAIRGSQAWNSNDSRIAKRMALLVFTDFLCWAPIALFSLTALSGVHLINLEEAKVFTIFVLPLNSCANPFLYAIFTKQFKRDCVLICKRIEESRVTRGIGRCRHSSNFSNRHTLVNTNSAGERKSLSNEQQCQCQCGMIKSIARDHLISSQGGWKKFARKYLLCQDDEQETEYNAYNMALVRIQRNMERGANRTSSISSENFSSRSDSWRQGSVPLRLIDRNGQRKSSWVVTRKASQDSSISCSRQDSSTSTIRITSRSSISSGEAGHLLRGLHMGHVGPHGYHGGCGGPCSSHGPLRPQPGKAASLDPTLARLYRTPLQGKPQLCRQLAVDDGFRSFASQSNPHSHGHSVTTSLSTSNHNSSSNLNHHQHCTAANSVTASGSHSGQGMACIVSPGHSPPHLRRSKGDQLCSACAHKEMGLVGPLGSLGSNGRKDDKFSCFYNRLTETSREDSSEISKDDAPGISEQSEPHHSKNKNNDMAITLDNTNSNSEDVHAHSIPSTATTGVTSSDGHSVPDSSIPTEGLVTDFSTDSGGPPTKESLKLAKKDESKHSSKEKKDKKIKKNQQQHQQAGRHHISVDDINAKTQAFQSGHTGAAGDSASRKTASDNSLKKLSLRNLPQFLRQLSSSQSPKNSTQIPQSTTHGQYLGPPSGGLPSSKSDTGIAQRDDWTSLEAHTERASSSESESEPSEIRFVAQSCSPTPQLLSIRTGTLPPDDEPDPAEHSPLI